MAKRFTDTDKWNDPWFLELPATIKLLWQYLWEHANGSGIVTLHLPIVSLHLGCSVTKQEIDMHLAGKAVWTETGKLWLAEFLPWTRTNLNPKNKSHLTMIRTWLSHASKYGFDGQFQEVFTEYTLKSNITIEDDRQSIDSRSTLNSNSNSNSNSSSENRAARQETGEVDGDVVAILRQAIRQKGYNQSEQAKQMLGPFFWSVVKEMGGWISVCKMPEGERFEIKAYSANKRCRARELAKLKKGVQP